MLICTFLIDDSEYPNLKSILDLYGIKVNNGLLYEGENGYYLAYRNLSPTPYILMPTYAYGNSISEKFDNSTALVMPYSQSLTLNNVEEENVDVVTSDIILTSSNCYNIVDYKNGVTSATLEGLEKSQYTIGAEAVRTITDGEKKTESKLVVYGNTSFLMDTYRDGNIEINLAMTQDIDLALNTFAELGEQKGLITVRKNMNTTYFQSTEKDTKTVRLIVFGIPVAIILVGIIVWNYRRRKR